jgi:EAL domain-containing protein (putative c-di-GMP-specific phosphodiesterase class I)/GGDEF domain-containing protein
VLIKVNHCNRLFFKEQLESWLEESHQGGVVIIRTDLLADAKKQLNFKDAEAIIKELCSLLKSATEQEDVILARCSENELAILMRSITIEKLRSIGDMLDALLKALHQHHPILQNVHYNVAMLHNQKNTNSREIFSRLDNALSVLEQSSSNTISLQTDENSDPIFGRLEWKALIEKAIDQKQFKHKTQAIFQQDGKVHHLELFSAIETNSGKYQPTQFLGAIETLDMGAYFDQYVIHYAIQRLQSDTDHPPIAINITQSSVKDPAFINWLNIIMRTNQTLKSRLYFEIPEICFYRQKDSTYLFCDNIRRLDFAFGIDNYGRYFSDLDYVHEIKPNYVKIDYIYTYHLNDKLRSDTLSSLCRTAHSLDITTIATKVETETQKNRLSELFVCAYQGYVNRETEKS